MDDEIVTLVVESKHYEFSKKKLSESSGYFTAMFNSDFIEKNKSVIKLEDVNVTSWEHILNYLKLGRIQQPEKEVLVEEMLELLKAATMLQFIDVQDRCSRILYDVLDVSNAIQVLEIASLLDSANLIHKARAIVLWNFDDVTKLDSFYKLNADQVEGYVSDSALHSWTGEWGVWEAVDRWLNSSDDFSESRAEYLPRLIKCLHLESLSLSDLRCIALYNSVQASPLVSKSIQKIIKNRTSDARQKETDAEEEKVEDKDSDQITEFIEQWKQTGPRKLPLVPCVVGTIHSDPNTTSPCIIKFCETEGKFIPVLRLNKVETSLGSMVGFKVIADGSKLYMLGGVMLRRENAWNHAIWMYDQIHKTWTFLSNLLKPSRHLAACCIGDDLYIIGGFGRHRVAQEAVSKLSIKDRIWTVCAPLPRPLYSVPCCVFRNQIYVIGYAVYHYIPSRDVWITLDVSLPAKGFSNAMANDNFIFLSGAYTGNVYKFDPSHPSQRLDTVGSFKNECVQACLIDDHIYSLSQDEFSEDIYCEKMNVNTGETIVLWEGKTDSKIADLNPKHRHGCFPLLLY